MADRREIETLRNEVRNLRKASQAQVETIADLARLADEMSVTPLAALLALIDTLDAHGIPKTEFMKNLDRASLALFPQAESMGGIFGATLGAMVQDPSARRPPAPESPE